MNLWKLNIDTMWTHNYFRQVYLGRNEADRTLSQLSLKRSEISL